MEGKNRISELFSKYVAGTADSAEVSEFLEMMKHTDAEQMIEDETEQLWHNVTPATGNEADWHRIYNIAIASDPEVVPVRSISRNAWLSAAAIFICICTVAIWLNINKKSDVPLTQYSMGKAAAGKTLVVHLCDGTKVTLNSGSELRYPESFGTSKREVYLTGEAYFEVAHNASKSFLVHSGKMVTSVLGTSFNVMAYPDIKKMSVTVLTGKVAVKDTVSQALVTLLPKERANLSTGESSISVDTLKDVNDMIAWKNGELVFNNASLEEIALKVSNRFGTTINVSNTEKRQSRITGTFNKQSLLEILKAITRLTSTKFEQRAKDFIIY